MTDLEIRLPNPCDEKWSAMSRTGCNRFCASCSTHVIDLSKLDADSLESFLNSGEKACVRAVIAPDGTVQTKQQSNGRMVVFAAAAASLAACQAFNAKFPEIGSISGSGLEPDTKVTAVDSTGRKYRTHAARDGTYTLRRLYPGKYRLSSSPSGCTEIPANAEVTVRANETVAAPKTQIRDCDIIIGMIERVEKEG